MNPIRDKTLFCEINVKKRIIDWSAPSKSKRQREVKKFLVKCANKPRGTSRHLPKPKDMEFVPTLKILTKKIVRPTHEETLDNSRARSARLRAAERTSAPTLTHQSQTKMEGGENDY